MAATSSFIPPPSRVPPIASTFFSNPRPVTVTASFSPFATPSRFTDGNSPNDSSTSSFSSFTSTSITSSSSLTFPPIVTQIVTTAPPVTFATPLSVFPSSSSATDVVVTPTSDGSGTTTHFRTAAVIVVFSILGLIVLGILATVTTIIRKHLRVQRKLRQDAEDPSAPMLPGNRTSGMHEVPSGSGLYGR